MTLQVHAGWWTSGTTWAPVDPCYQQQMHLNRAEQGIPCPGTRSLSDYINNLLPLFLLITY